MIQNYFSSLDKYGAEIGEAKKIDESKVSSKKLKMIAPVNDAVAVHVPER